MLIKNREIDSYLKCSAGLFFLLLYPGFAFYNTIVSYGLFPPIFGGFFGLFTVLYLLSLFPILFKLRARYIYEYESVFFYIVLILSFFCLVLFSAFLNYIFYPSEPVSLALKQVIETFVLLAGAFFIGMNIELNNKLYRISSFIVTLSAGLLVFYVLKTGSVMFYAKSFAGDSVTDAISTYQGFSRSAMVLCFLVMSVVKSQRNNIIFYIVSVFILFVLGSRSELVGFAFGAGLMLIFKFKLRASSVFRLLILLLLLTVLFNFLYENFTNNRNFQLLDLSSSTSWTSREYLESLAINHILENPIFGYFAGHVIDGGSAGAYVHSILSVWAGFGFIPFVIYGLLCLIPFIDCMKIILNTKSSSSKLYFCFSLSAATVLLVLFAKSMFWFIPGLAWGLYINVKKEISNEY